MYYHSLPRQYHTGKVEIFKVILTYESMWISLHKKDTKKKGNSIHFVVSIAENKKDMKKRS